MSRRAGAFLVPICLCSASAGSEAFGLLESMGMDDECGALGLDGAGCAVSALQQQAQRTKIDLESSEGADLVEATRVWYGSHSAEGIAAEVEENGTRNLLGSRDDIAPPRTAFEYNGISWPAMNVSVAEAHFFAVGDWGGLDGALQPPDEFPRMITYPGGHLHGPHVFPRSRLGCSHSALNDCFFGGEKYCKYSCGFASGIDDRAQLVVAKQMRKRAARHDPQFILNVGDNFYWGGIAKECGYPMDRIHPATRHQFNSIFEEVYTGRGLKGKPWLSVLGNHDWGGRMFTAGWDQQIAYTWASDRWLMPAVYWHQRVNFPGYAADIFMVDTNHNDAKSPDEDKETNICGAQYNKNGASCASAGGPRNVDDCKDWFQTLWKAEQEWLERMLAQSTADWQIIVTHFPCDQGSWYWRSLHDKYGLDLLVTGHRHDQELWKANTAGLGGLTCFVTGGGGGITSEESPLPWTPTHGWRNVNTQYGFFDMTISRSTIKVESVDYRGNVVATTEVRPKAGR